MEKSEAFEKIKEKGMRLTKLRKRLVEFILSQAGHWSIQNLTNRAKRAVPGVGVATVYRTVNLLVEQGSLSKTQVGSGPARFEVRPDKHHDHITCLNCGVIVEFANPEIEAAQEKVANSLGFHLIDHQMELFGECRECRKKTRKPK